MDFKNANELLDLCKKHDLPISEVMRQREIIEGEKEAGELFFYYVPKGILKKKPVNVYEIPSKFNIDETEYLKLVDALYSKIKELRKKCTKFALFYYLYIN